MQNRQKAGEKDGRSAAPSQVELGASPVVFADPTSEARKADAGAEPPTEPESDALADQGTHDHDHNEHDEFGDRSDGRGSDDDDGVSGHDQADQNASSPA
jgi:hypothetical protein